MHARPKLNDARRLNLRVFPAELFDGLFVRQKARAEDIAAIDDLVVLDRLSQQYLGRPFPRRKWSSRVVYVIAADVARYYRSPLEHTPG